MSSDSGGISASKAGRGRGCLCTGEEEEKTMDDGISNFLLRKILLGKSI